MTQDIQTLKIYRVTTPLTAKYYRLRTTAEMAAKTYNYGQIESRPVIVEEIDLEPHRNVVRNYEIAANAQKQKQKCKVCGVEKDVSKFYKMRSKPMKTCKMCMSDAYHKNKNKTNGSATVNNFLTGRSISSLCKNV
jgi:hypothetical protein